MILSLLAVGCAHHFDGLLTQLRCLPELVGDDPKIWHVLDDPFLLWIEPRHALAGIGILHEALSVPDDPADIHLVVEDAGAALGIAVYCAEAPSPSAGGSHALTIEFQGDPLCRLSGGVAAKNASNDLGFDLVDGAITTHRFAARGQLYDDVIAIAVAPSRLAVFDATAQSASRLVGQIFEEQGVHRALEADMQLRDLTLGKGRNLDAGEPKALVEAGDVLLISAQPIQCLGQHELKSPGQRISDQRLDARSENER